MKNARFGNRERAHNHRMDLQQITLFGGPSVHNIADP